MARYSSNNFSSGTQQVCTSAFKTAMSLTAETTTLGVGRGAIYEFNIGADGTPADTSITWDISRQTAAGTATAGVAVALDGADVAGRILLENNYTAEGTITAASSLWTMPINQRASYRWIAAPGSELIIPATDENGFAFRFKSAAYTSTVLCSVFHQE